MNFVSIVLAAGSARRFGSDKLSVPFLGEPMVRHAIRAARAAPVGRVIVVCSPGLDIATWEGAPPVTVLRISSNALSESLRAGIIEAADADGAFIFLGDMPLVPHDVAGQLAQVLGESFAAVPRHEGKLGHPVLLSSRAFAAIARLEGDQGAGRLLRSRSDVAGFDVADPAILLDVDRTEDLGRLESRENVKG